MNLGNIAHIVIVSDAVHTRTIPARGDRAAIQFREQRAAIERGEDFPKPFNIQLADDQPAYKPGRYLLDMASLEVNEYESLRVGRRVKLVPLPAPAK